MSKEIETTIGPILEKMRELRSTLDRLIAAEEIPGNSDEVEALTRHAAGLLGILAGSRPNQAVASDVETDAKKRTLRLTATSPRP